VKEELMSSPRVLKLADQIKLIVAEMLQRRIKDPRLGFVTITDVRLTGDSQDATVFYTVLGSDEDQASTAAALRSATGLIRSEVGKQLGLRFTPRWHLCPTPSGECQADRRSACPGQVDRRAGGRAGCWGGVRGGI
jgi:ribosome-binding factor A